MVTNESRRRRRALLALTVGVLIVLAVLATSLMLPRGNNGASSSSTSVTPAMVSVFGFVSTTGAGTHPTSITFTSERDGKSFVAAASSGGGHFSIELPNHDRYNVAVGWAGNYSWQAGQTGQGELSLNMSAGSQMAQSYSTVASTSDTVTLVEGSVLWHINGSNLIGIRFTAGDGENFTAALENQGNFSIRLPNLMNYEVYIQSQNATGHSDWYYAHQIEVSAPANVVGLIVRIAP